MTEALDIRIVARVSPEERRAVDKAAELVSTSFGAAAKTPVNIRCEFAETEAEFDRPDAPTLVLTSLLGEMDRLDEPWADAEARLRARYAALSAGGRRVVYVCTLLRHIGEDLSRATRDARRVRLRRLNLLAVELSRELGLIVVDIDRDLAALGAASLETDYRPGGALRCRCCW